MKAEELRLGNLVNEKGDIVPIGFRSFQYMKENESLFFDWVKPIPLTEKWLLKFGFFLNNRNEYAMIQRGFTSAIVITTKNDYDYFLFEWYINMDEKITLSTVETVHDLQNKIFALTGEELELTK